MGDPLLSPASRISPGRPTWPSSARPPPRCPASSASAAKRASSASSSSRPASRKRGRGEGPRGRDPASPPPLRRHADHRPQLPGHHRPRAISSTRASPRPCPGRGNIAFISQSGALCTSVLDWALEEKIGFSYFVSIGNTIDVDFGDLIDYFGEDEETKSIILYIESIDRARKFMTAARAFARTKPIVAYKAGRFPESAAGRRLPHGRPGRRGRRLRRGLPARRHGPRLRHRRDLRRRRARRPPQGPERGPARRSSRTPAAPASWPPTR